jgi:hypothetical protein
VLVLFPSDELATVVLGAVGGVLAITVVGVAAKRRGV